MYNESREKWQIRGSLSEALQNKNLTDFVKKTERFNWTHENLRHLILFEQLKLLFSRKKKPLELYIRIVISEYRYMRKSLKTSIVAGTVNYGYNLNIVTNGIECGGN